ncbi:MAG: CPBP family intramembrane glutamic endopeptidase [Verrucomicrobiota bacterium]
MSLWQRERTMQNRNFKIFLFGVPIFLTVVMVVSAVLSPPVFYLVEGLAPDRWPFKRVFNRVLMVAAVLCLVPWLKLLNAYSWDVLGLRLSRGWWRGLYYGWMIGVLQVVILGGVHLLFGARVWNWELEPGSFMGYVASGIAVGLIEEFIFRGGLCLSLRELPQRALIIVIVLGSTFFALVHFPHAEHLPGSVTAMSGWVMWGDLGRQFLDPADVIQRWCGLWLAGICLCVAAIRTGSLWLPIGIHAGWVCGIKSNNQMSDATAEATGILWGGHPLDGVVAWVFLLILLVWLLKGKVPRVEYST